MRRYGNARKVKADGHTFDSKAEARRYGELQLMRAAKVINNIEVHPRIPIEIGGVKVRYPSGRQMTYVADFRYWDVEKGKHVVEDVKMASGHLTEVFKIKQALVNAMGIVVQLVR